MLNRYGLLAKEMWESHAPGQLAAMEDSESFFQELGARAAEQIEEVAQHLEQTTLDPTGLDDLQLMRQRRMIRKQAEELVLTELIYDPVGQSAMETETLDEMLWQLPSPSMVQDSIRFLQRQAESDAESEGRSEVILDEEQAEEMAHLQRLLALVDVDLESLSPEQEQERIEALRPYLAEQL